MVHPLEDGTELGCCCETEKQQMENDYEIAYRIVQNALEQALERPLSIQEVDAIRWLTALPSKSKQYSDGGQFFVTL